MFPLKKAWLLLCWELVQGMKTDGAFVVRGAGAAGVYQYYGDGGGVGEEERGAGGAAAQ